MSKLINQLRETRAKNWEAAKAYLNNCKRDENGFMSAEDNAVYEKMEADIIALGKEVERLERQEAMDAEFNRIVNAPITEKPDTGISKPGRAADEYRRAFWDAMRGRQVTNALSVGTDTEGGYLVPDEYEKTIIAALEDENIIRKIANIIQTDSGERKIPIVTARGSAAWVDEGALIPESDDVFGQIAIGAYKLATMIKVSEELLNDSVFSIEQYIATEFARRIGTEEEKAFIIGDGSGKPTGFLNATGGAGVGTTTASTSAITLDEIMDLYFSLRMPYRNKAVFVANDLTIKALRKLKDATGQYIWQPSVQAGTPDTLLNRPVMTSAYMPEIAEGAKVIAFGDFHYYWIADRQGRTFKRLNELYAPTGQVGFLASQRVDGKLVLPEAIKLLQIRNA